MLIVRKVQGIAYDAAIDGLHSGRAVGNDDHTGAQALTSAVPQASVGKKMVVDIQVVVCCEQDGIAATQTPMLVGVIQYHALYLRAILLQASYALHPVCAHRQRYVGEMEVHLHGFVADSGCRCRCIRQAIAVLRPSIAARQDCDLVAVFAQQGYDVLRHRCLAGASDRQISDTDSRYGDAVRGQDMRIVEPVTHPHRQCVHGGYGYRTYLGNAFDTAALLNGDGRHQRHSSWLAEQLPYLHHKLLLLSCIVEHGQQFIHRVLQFGIIDEGVFLHAR